MIVSACPACGTRRVTELERINIASQHVLYAPANPELQALLNESAAKSASDYQLLRCDECQLEFSSPMLAPNAEWYKLAYQHLSLYPEERWEFTQVIRRLRPMDVVAELGCGSGAFLELLRIRGFQAFGLDFADDAIQACLGKGLDAYKLELGQPRIAPSQRNEKANHITAFHVLEHLDEPGTLFDDARHFSLPNATLWISVPGRLRVTRHFGEIDFLDQPPHHMTRWTENAFFKLGRRCGWRLVKTTHEPISVNAALWNISTRVRSYKAIENHRFLANRNSKRLVRAALMPISALRRLTTHRRFTGFSMLCQFVMDKKA